MLRHDFIVTNMVAHVALLGVALVAALFSYLACRCDPSVAGLPPQSCPWNKTRDYCFVVAWVAAGLALSDIIFAGISFIFGGA